MRRLSLRLAFAVSLCCSAAVSAGRITFERIVPAPHDLGGVQDLAVIYAIGDTERLTTFLDVFIDQANQAGTLRVHDARDVGASLTTSELARRRYRRRFGSELFLQINAFTCSMKSHSGEGSVHDFEGKRVRRSQQWVDAVCRAHVHVLEVDTLRQRSDFDVRGEGTSPRVARVTAEEQRQATDQAARYAAVAAAEEITPRRVRETIDLEEKAPAFEEGMAMIAAGRLPEARRIWEAAAARRRDAAALHFNLGAVCEALGDVDAARRHYAEARRAAPGERRYRVEMEMFRRRNRLRE
jgi:tetratricopeptide (TPR) repeat protein